MNKLVIRSANESINDVISNNPGKIIVYGMTYWSSLLIKSGKFKVDYVCDKRAIICEGEGALSLDGVPVVSVEQLGNIISDKRATIIVCASNCPSTADSIFIDLVRYDYNADVFDYFGNVDYFSDKYFIYKNERIDLFEHPYNCGYTYQRMTERSVELSLGRKYFEEHENIYEIGAVTPYYFESNNIEKIIDPTDPHKRVTKASLFDVDLTGKNVLSISTVEHIGTADYGMSESLNVVDAVNKILSESHSCLITAPFGYNRLLDDWLESNKENQYVHVLERKINNHWEEVDLPKWDGKCDYTPLWANGLIIIEK